MECITAQDQSDIDAGGETEDKDERSDEEAQTPRCQSDWAQDVYALSPRKHTDLSVMFL